MMTTMMTMRTAMTTTAMTTMTTMTTMMTMKTMMTTAMDDDDDDNHESDNERAWTHHVVFTACLYARWPSLQRARFLYGWFFQARQPDFDE
eukprot:12272313-Karenia_brevis.AAC.1